ncbi:AMP-binding protein [Streptomyces calidiresistens]|uniref:AMP-binding protein n=1 Tax=Streptomyces calidiresistens TaxID=1485586 RepID=A0A7W3XWM5_9ACTN|nr:AMP-binding protein [Streptomyces calidiresistens]MBB0230034.1 AMP-binding protein [Streptomyces calidiresistens]
MSPGEVFRAARDVLLRHRTDWEAAVAEFRRPELPLFNWALDWFDTLGEGPERPALRLVGAGGPETDRILGFGELSERSDRLANWLRSIGVERGDPVLLMLDNREPVWESMLAAIKLGAVLVPTYTTATPAELRDRVLRGEVRYVIAEAALSERFAGVPGEWVGIGVGGPARGWLRYEDFLGADPRFVPDGVTRGEDPLFRYFTSGTTSAPKMVEHTHLSYPVGHLSGMYWNGVRPGDVHLNISAPGWAKHAWSSFFVPWNAEATVVALDAAGSTPRRVSEVLRDRGVTTFCAPPTVWRALVTAGLGDRPPALREAVAAGEPLEPSVVREVARRWDLSLRDGYGQTETTGQIGNPPGRVPVPGSMGVPLPGYRITLVDPETDLPVPDGEPGEICLDLSERPLGLMRGYAGDPERTARAMAGGRYRTGDLAVRAPDGNLTHVARADDMFKSFDHRISPRELETVLLAHPAVADAAVVPVPDPIGLWVPKACVVPAPGHAAGPGTAHALFAAVRSELPPEKWVRVVEFVTELPRTSSGKTRRAELRERSAGARGPVYRIDAPATI